MKVKIRSDKFRERMATENVSLTDLAGKVKVGQSYISQLVSGKRFPGPKIRKKIVGVLGIKKAEWYQYFEVV